MAYTRQEYYVDDDSYRSNIYSTDWECQTFTASEDYTLTKLSLKIGRMNAGTVENAVVSIRATDIVTGAPTGGDLAVATILVSDLIQSNDCRWEDFSFSLALTSGVKYAICLRPTSPTVGLVWRLNTNGTYAGGQRGRSTDSGVTWIVATYVSTDFAFQTYKDAVAYEGYDLSDATFGMYGSNWYAQTFLTISAHTVSAIMLNMARVGTVGICTASIRATDALTGQPTGPDLVSGTFDASDITFVTGGEDCIFYIDSLMNYRMQLLMQLL